MSRHRVEERARVIYDLLKDNLNIPYPIGELLTATNLKDSQTTRSAIKMAREFAVDDGLCFPVACPANNMTYCVTDQPGAVFDPSLHLGRIALGVGVRKDIHDDFMRSRLGKLSQSERAMFHAQEKYEAAQRASRDAYIEITKAMVSMRKENRS